MYAMSVLTVVFSCVLGFALFVFWGQFLCFDEFSSWFGFGTAFFPSFLCSL